MKTWWKDGHCAATKNYSGNGNTSLIFGKAGVVLVFLVVDEVAPEEWASVQQLVQLPEDTSLWSTRQSLEWIVGWWPQYAWWYWWWWWWWPAYLSSPGRVPSWCPACSRPPRRRWPATDQMFKSFTKLFLNTQSAKTNTVHWQQIKPDEINQNKQKNNCYLWMSHSCAVFVGIRCLVGKLLFSKHRKSEKRRRYILDRSPFWILESEKMHTGVKVYEPDAQNLRPITLTQLFAEEIGSNDFDLCNA